MKKLFTLFLALAACAGTLFAWDYERVQIDGLYYNLDASTQTAEVTSQISSSPYWSTAITTANIPASVIHNEITYSVTSIGSSAFAECSSLTSVTIPESVTSIGFHAFAYCSGLTSVTIGNGVTSIGNTAFQYCSGLTSVTIPNGVTIIGNQAFEGCSGLTSVTIPNSVTSIGDYAFQYCSGLTSVTIPNSVTIIGNQAFMNCSGLTSVTIPNSVTSIGDYAFYNVPNIVYSGDATGSPWGARSRNGYVENYLVFDNETKTTLLACSSSALGEINIPNSVTSIGQLAFSNCTGLTSVTIPNSVTSIGWNAFYNVPNIVYSGDATGSPWGARSRNGYVDGYLVYSNNTKITLRACSSAAQGEIIIPNSVTSIGSSAFSSCSGLTSVTIPNSVTSIGRSAFYQCTGLTSVTIGNRVTSIGIEAFRGCSGLTSVTIPNSVTSIGERAFLSCSGLTSVTIPNRVTRIGDYAFNGCSGLTSVTIPNSVTSIGRSAFYQCTGLTSIDVAADNPNYSSEEGVLFNKDKTTLVAYPGGKQGAYAIPNSVTSIGSSAFNNCSGLTSVTIPSSVTSIGGDAFYRCTGLTSVTNYATTPQTINSNVFIGVDKSSCKLYVPIEAVSAYQSTSVWQDFPIGGAAVSSKADPDNTSAYYTTFFDSSNKYRLPAGMEAYTAIINGDVLSLTKVAEGGEVIPANEAFILKSNAAHLNMDITEEDPVAVGPNALLGVDTATPSPANCYVLSGKSSDNSVQGLGFYQFSGTLGAHKAYLVLGGGASGAPRRLRFSFNETNTATGVEEVQTNQVQPTKLSENGQVVIMYKGTKYNVQGARVE